MQNISSTTFMDRKFLCRSVNDFTIQLAGMK